MNICLLSLATLAMCSRYLPRETKASSMGGVSKNVFVGEWVKRMVTNRARTWRREERRDGGGERKDGGRGGGEKREVRVEGDQEGKWSSMHTDT